MGLTKEALLVNAKWLLPVADVSVETDEVDTRPAGDIETGEA